MTTTKTFGERLRRLCEARGLRKTVLARQVDLREAAIRQLEFGGSSGARLADGVRIAAVLGVEPGYLAFADTGQT